MNTADVACSVIQATQMIIRFALERKTSHNACTWSKTQPLTSKTTQILLYRISNNNDFFNIRKHYWIFFFIRAANFHGNYQYCLMLCLFFFRSVLFIFSDNFAEKSRIMNHSWQVDVLWQRENLKKILIQQNQYSQMTNVKWSTWIDLNRFTYFVRIISLSVWIYL